MIRSGIALALTAIVCAGPAPAVAQQDCSAITDDAARLKCFDAARPQEKPPGFNAPSPQTRAGYAELLRRTMLSNGFSASVWASEKKSKDDTASDPLKVYPRLTIFPAVLTDAMVYQLMHQGKVLENARKLGFQGIELASKLGSGGYWYDIRGNDPRPCDVNKRLCL